MVRREGNVVTLAFLYYMLADHVTQYRFADIFYIIFLVNE
jgi:hypothetical protein